MCTDRWVGINLINYISKTTNATSLAKVTGSKFDLAELFRLLVLAIEQGYIHSSGGKWLEIKRESICIHLYLKIFE